VRSCVVQRFPARESLAYTPLPASGYELGQSYAGLHESADQLTCKSINKATWGRMGSWETKYLSFPKTSSTVKNDSSGAALVYGESRNPATSTALLRSRCHRAIRLSRPNSGDSNFLKFFYEPRTVGSRISTTRGTPLNNDSGLAMPSDCAQFCAHHQTLRSATESCRATTNVWNRYACSIP
jgi:hypothetical protein